MWSHTSVSFHFWGFIPVQLLSWAIPSWSLSMSKTMLVDGFSHKVITLMEAAPSIHPELLETWKLIISSHIFEYKLKSETRGCFVYHACFEATKCFWISFCTKPHEPLCLFSISWHWCAWTLCLILSLITHLIISYLVLQIWSKKSIQTPKEASARVRRAPRALLWC